MGRGMAVGVVAALAAAVLGGPASAQRQQMLRVEGEVHIVQEAGVVLEEADGSLSVLLVLPAGARPKGYEDVELVQGDRILMVNGKRVKTTKDLAAAYDALAVGEEVALGLRRGEGMRIVAFPKADPDELSRGGRVMMASGGGPPPGGAAPGGGPMIRTMTLGSGDGLEPLPGTGLILGDRDGAVTVAHLLPHAAKQLGGADVREGDVLAAVNGQAVATAAAATQAWDAVAIGESVSLTFRRGGDETAITLAKPELQGRMIIQGH